VIGWANAGVSGTSLQVQAGFVSGRAPCDAVFRREWEAERERLAAFLGVGR
jgi:hypothetical protein